MKSRAQGTVAISALVVSSVLSAQSMAQPAEPSFEFAEDHFIVKVREGVVPVVLPGGLLSFAQGQDDNQDPAGEVAELLIASFLDECNATVIEPVIQFEMTDAVLALATQTGLIRQYTVDVAPGTDIALVADILSLFVSHIESATPDWYVQFFQCQPPPATNDTFLCDQWALHNEGQPLCFSCTSGPGCGPCGNGQCLTGTPDADIDAPEAWSLETGSPDVIVAVIDTGAYMTHPDLVGKLVSGQNFARNECVDSCDLPPNGCNPSDTPCETQAVSHGTFIAGIIGAATNNGQGIAGVSPGSRVMPLRTPSALASEVNPALTFAAGDANVRVINMSFGAKQGSLEDGLSAAAAAEKLIVAAAGNCFGTIPPEGCMNPVAYPASDPRVIAVTSTNFRDERSCFAHLGPQLAVAAPGEDIVSTWNAQFGATVCLPGTDPEFYCRSNGTSFATPHVAGLAALIYSVDPNFTNLRVRRIIMATADDLGETGHDDLFGCGRINAFRAVSRALCPANVVEDCVIGIQDFLAVLQVWGACPSTNPCCPADLDGDGVVGVLDFLEVLGQWGPCGPNCLSPPSLAQEIAVAGLTQAEWDTLRNCVVNGTAAQSANCVCWMEHYMDCHRNPACAPLPHPVTCPGADPLGHH